MKYAILAFLLFSVIPIVYLALNFILWILGKPLKLLGGRNLLAVTLAVLLSIFFTRAAFDCWLMNKEAGVELKADTENFSGVSTGEAWFESFVDTIGHTIQTFGVDSAFRDFASRGEEMIYSLADEWSAQAEEDGNLLSRGEDYLTSNASTVAAYFRFQIVLQNLLAPILSGTILFSILTELMPDLRAIAANCLIWKRKYYINHLDERSVALAESLHKREDGSWLSPVVIIFDAKSCPEDVYERLKSRTREIRAIVLERDISDYFPKFPNKKNYILMHEDAAEKLREFAALLDEKNIKHIKRTSIFILNLKDDFLITEHNIYTNAQRNMFEKRKLKKWEETKAKKKLIEKKCDIYRDKGIKYNEKTGQVVPAEIDPETENRVFKKAVARLLQDCGEQLPNGNALNETELTEFAVSSYARWNYFKDHYGVRVFRANCYQNLVWNILKDVPLYSPFIGVDGKITAVTEDTAELKVAIIGSGDIGTQMFLTTTWMGQMLDTRLRIGVISLEEEGSFKARINKINPEILGSTDPSSEILKIYRNREEYAAPYFSFQYLKSDLSSASVKNLSTQYGKLDIGSISLLDYDYFFVALGSDAENIRVAEELQRELEVHDPEKPSSKVKHIVLSVYDSSLRERFQVYDKNQANRKVLLHGEGDLKEQYSYKTLFADMNKKKNKKETNSIEGKYRSQRQSLAKASEEQFQKVYEGASSAARNLHTDTKQFSVYKASCLNSGEEAAETFAAWKKVHEETLCKEDEQLLRYSLGWLEHRRWNAYLRSIGFRSSSADVAKNVFLRTHPCLVEWKKPSQEDIENTNYKIPYITGDILDEVSYRQETLYKAYDFWEDLSTKKAKQEAEQKAKQEAKEALKVTGELFT